MRRDDDFVRGAENTATELTRIHQTEPDVSNKRSETDWQSFAQLAWRPAWSIRSRRGALRPLVQSIRGWLDAVRSKR